MNKVKGPSEYADFSSRPEVITTMANIKNAFVPLNEKLARTSVNYDSLVVFSAEPSDTVAVPLLAIDAPRPNSQRHTFRDTSIMGRQLLLPGTTLKKAMDGEDIGFYAESAINHEYDQLTHTEVLHLDDKQVALVQYSYTAAEAGDTIATLPDDADITALWQDEQRAMARAALGVATLQGFAHELQSPLGLELEQQEPLAPNGFFIRWDVEGASEIALSHNRAKLQKFLNRAHLGLSRLASDYVEDPGKSHWNIRDVYDNQGDGAYVFLPIAEHFNPYDPYYLEDFRKYTAQRYIDDMNSLFTELNTHSSMKFKVNVTGDFGFAEPDSTGRIDAATMYALAKQQKEK